MLLQHGEGLMCRGGGGGAKTLLQILSHVRGPPPPPDPEKNRPALLNVAEEHQSSPPWSKTEPDRPECPSPTPLSPSLSPLAALFLFFLAADLQTQEPR